MDSQRPHQDGDPRPEERCGHIAVCLGYVEEHKIVLVSGGWNGSKVFSDTWLLDPHSGKWKEVSRVYLCSI